VSEQTGETGSPPIAWHWTYFLLGAVYAIPAMTVLPFNATAGLALAVGVLPVAAFPLPATRRARRTVPVVGALSALGFVLGSLLTQVPPLAVVAMFGLAFGGVMWARRGRAGALVLALVLPLTGIALSYEDFAQGASIALLVLGGSLYGWVIGSLWPERTPLIPPRPQEATRREAVVYGILLGLAAACAAAIGYALSLEHVGWATGAALLVMRPTRQQLLLRSVGRATSVVLGALCAAVFAALPLPTSVTVIAVGAVLASLSATQGSRWYVAGAFTTFLALTLILQDASELPGARFAERTLETAIGVGLALLFGVVIPSAIRAIRSSRRP
jgi:hypothetical protein